MELSADAVRVLGCLVEKQQATPQYYPLTRNSLVAACNQTTSRDPVMQLGDGDVGAALDELRVAGLARVVLSPGNRTDKYRHVLDEALGLGAGEAAVLAILALRGPQTEAEVRARAERLCGDDGAVDFALRRLQERDDPLITKLDRQPGQKEARMAHLLSGVPVLVPSAATGGGAGGGAAAAERIADLEARVEQLESQVAALRATLGRAEEHIEATDGDDRR